MKTRNGLHEYTVRNLSVGGALLSDGPPLPRGCPLIAILHIPFYPEVRVAAKAVHQSVDRHGMPKIGIEFIHHSDITEDHIQAALLSELERSRTNGCIADVLLG